MQSKRHGIFTKKMRRSKQWDGRAINEASTIHDPRSAMIIQSQKETIKSRLTPVKLCTIQEQMNYPNRNRTRTRTYIYIYKTKTKTKNNVKKNRSEREASNHVYPRAALLIRKFNFIRSKAKIFINLFQRRKIAACFIVFHIYTFTIICDVWFSIYFPSANNFNVSRFRIRMYNV